MIKVLHLLNTGKYSGAENVAITIINNTKDRFNHIYISPEGEIRDILKDNKIEFCSVEKINYAELKRVIKLYNPDVIHAHDFTTSIIASLFQKKVKVISHIHNNPPWLEKYGIYSILYFLCAKSFKKILCVSDSIQNEYVFATFLKNKMDTIGNPVDINLIKKKSNEFCIEGKFDLIFIGRLCEQKNPMLFLDIIERVSQVYPNIKVAILGDGEYKDEIKRVLKEKKLEDKVILYGFISNPYPYLKNAKVLCMTSLWEGYGLVAVEALALNKPVLATPVGGLVNIISTNCGMLCDSLDEFVNEIISLLNSDKLYEQKSLATAERLKKISNLDNYMNYIAQLYCD